MNIHRSVDLVRTEVFKEILNNEGAWKKSDVVSKDKAALYLKPEHLAAIDELLAKTRHLKPQEVTREQFDHPVLNVLLKDIYEEIMNRRGFIIIKGITPEKYSEEEFERIYWGFGTHWGTAVVQSPRGDRLGHVRYVEPTPEQATRAYTSASELYPHADSQEIVGLMCIQKAKTGGLSSLVSSLSVHNEIVKNRPDLLEPLYEGYQFTTREALQRGQKLTPYKVPIYSYLDNLLSCYYNRAYIYRAEEFTGPLPPKLREAMEYMNGLIEREDLVLDFMLEPGEMAIWHNFTVLHSRTAFEDHDDPKLKRHLLRLWLDVPNGRPMIPVYYRDLVAGT